MKSAVGMIGLVLSLLAPGGCDRRSQIAPEPAASSGPRVPDEQIPTPDEFDQQAFERINPGNAERELSKIEKDVDEGR